MSREKIKDFKDLLVYELRDIYSAETQLTDAMPKMSKSANDIKLQNTFDNHYKETIEQKTRLEKIAELLHEDLDGHTCHAMEGLLEECEEVINAQTNSAIKDAALIAAAQRVEHYEIAAYGTAVNYANKLGNAEIENLLIKTLNEEKRADSLLNEVAISSINIKAEVFS